MQAGLDPLRPAAMQCQTVGRDQQHLEEHEQVKQVTGKESPIDAHQLELEQGMEVGATAIITGAAIQQCRQRQHRSQQQHQGTELVQHQHDAERRLPVTQLIHPHVTLGGLLPQHQGNRHQSNTGEQTGHPPQPLPLTNFQQQQQPGQRRNQDGRNNPVRHERCSPS